MKKFIALLCVALLLFTLSACTIPDNDALPSFDLTGVEPKCLEELPQNELTSLVKMPESGSLDYVLDLTESSRYGIFWKDISREQSNAWLNGLLESGYKKVQYAANEVSVGTILKNGDVYLSIAYSDNALSVLIAKK